MKLKIGDFVQVINDSTHEGEYGTVINQNGTKDYPNDYWIQFERGDTAPYGDYELTVVTKEALELELAVTKKRLEYLKGRAK